MDEPTQENHISPAADHHPINIAQLRQSLAHHLTQHWQGEWPVYWQNMPPPSSLPDQGFLRFDMTADRIATLGLGQKFRHIQGTVRITLGVKKGFGMAVIDETTDQLSRIFSTPAIDGIRLSAIRIDRPFEENGFYLNRIRIAFSFIADAMPDDAA